MTETMKKPWLTTYELCTTALGAALMAICAWISIPTAVPFTLQTFAVFLVTGLLGLKCGTLSVLVYMLLGAVGLPVFTGFRGGFSALVGTTGGYLLGFIFIALTVGLLTRLFGRGLPVLIGSMALGMAICYAFGSAWFMILYTHATGPIAIGSVLSMCVVPFLIPDAIKILLAAFLTRRLQGQLKSKQ